VTELNAVPEAGEEIPAKKSTAGVSKAQNETNEKLMLAIFVGDLARMQELIANGASLTCRNHASQTPLMVACRMGHVEIAVWIIAQWCSMGGGAMEWLNAKDTLDRTALMVACEKDDLAIVSALMDAGVDVVAQDMVGRSAQDYLKDSANFEAIFAIVGHKNLTEQQLKPALATPKSRAPRRAVAHTN
jgi:ankyrin repeat protein